jgi:hypothetical protein
VIRLALVCLFAGLRDPGGAQPRAEAPRQDQRQVERHELSQRPTESVWRGYVEEWDRSLRAANKPLTTRCNYELAVTQLAEFLGGDDLTAFLASSGLVTGRLGQRGSPSSAHAAPTPDRSNSQLSPAIAANRPRTRRSHRSTRQPDAPVSAPPHPQWSRQCARQALFSG